MSTAAAFDSLLPDPQLTPGLVARKPTERRGVTEAMRMKVYKRYRISPERRAKYVIDHLIPKELGGADAVKNLWPQKIDAHPYNAARKEFLTGRFLKMIAAGEMTLAQAQQEMREDWISAFVIHVGMVHLTPRTLSVED
ncbi:MAG: HNH endonuclease signature motif containing protein [Chthoniobacterales bacterium]